MAKQKEKPTDPKSVEIAQPKLTKVNEILDTIKERKTIKEKSLSDALKSKEKSELKEAKKLFENAQKTYEKVRIETIKQIKISSEQRHKEKLVLNSSQKSLNQSQEDEEDNRSESNDF